MQAERTREFVEGVWEASIVPTLVDYIRIPNKSPHFDPDWAEHGHMEEAVQLLSGWASDHAIEGMKMEVVRLEGRTPVIFIEVPGEGDDTVLLYGHLDKQPEMSGWDADKGPWKPVLQDGKLYGRGGADDGYAIFSSLTALAALREQGVAHSRCVVLIEACEESGSFDLPHYLDHLEDRIGDVNLVVCLDSGCGNYDQLWSTTSLRGNVTGTLSVELIKEGIHSGNGSGIVASSFRVVRALLDRLEDSKTGEILLRELHAEIPGQRVEQAKQAAAVLGDAVVSQYPFLPGVEPVTTDTTEAVLNRTWRPALAVTGADGMPPVANAGNTLRPVTALKLSLRTPPTVSTAEVGALLKKTFETDPPYGARVRFEADGPADGWNAPELADWLGEAVDAASRAHFGQPAVYMGEGGSIPFMGMLGKKFPRAQFLITGVLGPGSNAHGPNEFLEIRTAKRLTACVADVLAAHHRTFGA